MGGFARLTSAQRAIQYGSVAAEAIKPMAEKTPSEGWEGDAELADPKRLQPGFEKPAVMPTLENRFGVHRAPKPTRKPLT
jgi:hypothetical protein